MAASRCGRDLPRAESAVANHRERRLLVQIPAKQALLQQLLADGIRLIFGNPGTVEETFLDALNECPEIEYVLGVQEAAVAAMADGYARVAGRPAVLQVHSAVGLGNATGVMYEASRSSTPMLVFAGETYLPLQAFDGFLGGDLVAMAKPVTKWAARVNDGSQLLRMVRRGLKVASTPPQGPVFLALPMDVLDQMVTPDICPTTLVDTQTRCSDDGAHRIAAALLNGENPLLLIGDGIAVSGAQAEVEELATLLALPIYGADSSAVNVSFRAPTFMGLLGHSFGDDTRRVTLSADIVLAVGTAVFPELFPSREDYFAPGARLFQIDLNSWEIAKNFPLEYGVQADPKLCLAEILLQARKLYPEGSDRVRKRGLAIADQITQQRTEWERNHSSAPAQESLSVVQMMRTLVEALPENALVYDESITSTDALLHFLRPKSPQDYVLGRGGCIGVGWPGAVGASFAAPNRIVIAPSGDGSALYVVQSLWTAAKYKRRIVFIVCNNRSYRILKVNLMHYWAEHGIEARPFPFMDLDAPAVDFTKIAEGFRVPAVRVTTAARFAEELSRAITLEGPFLIDVALDGSIPQSGGHPIRGHGGKA
jgi:thiamine pyrophosphate-dependent acetolactate synthase large subunit-like protein